MTATPTVSAGPRAAWLGPVGVAVAVLPLLQRALLHPDDPAPEHLGNWIACIATFLVADALAARLHGSTARAFVLGLASACALTAVWLIPAIYGGAALTAALLVVVAARLPGFSTPVVALWIAAQSIGLVAIYAMRWNAEVGGAAAFGFLCFQVIGYRFHATAASESRARRELAATRAELLTAARQAERNQIAADLHDVLGHHLVALQLQLEAARGPDGERHVEQARQLARLLLAEVRSVVDDMQETVAFDLVRAFDDLAADDLTPRVRLAVTDESGVQALPPASARECLRVVQEAVTNARKHGHASAVVIDVGRDSITVADDGRSWPGPATGRGLDGMADRCRTAGCTFDLDRQPGRGTTVRIGLPVTAERSVSGATS